MLKKSLSPTRVAREVGVAPPDGLSVTGAGPGKRSRIQQSDRKLPLTRVQRKQLEKILERGAVAWGFASEVWTGQRVAREFNTILRKSIIWWMMYNQA